MGFDLINLNSETKACALVGYFLQEFSATEEEMNITMATLFNIRPRDIIPRIRTRPFAKKVATLKKLVKAAPLEGNERQEMLRRVSQLHQLNDWRKVFAHDHFRYGPDHALVFVLNEEREPTLKREWSETDVLEKTALMHVLWRDLDLLNQRLGMREVNRLAENYMAAGTLEEKQAIQLANSPSNLPANLKPILEFLEEKTLTVTSDAPMSF